MKFRVLGMGALLTVTFLNVPQAAAQAAPPEPAEPPALALTPTSEPAAAAPPPVVAPPVVVPPTAPSVRPRVETAPEVPKSESDTPSSTPQEAFGFGAQIGFYNPNGVSVRAGGRAIAVQVTAGFNPVLLSYGSSQSPDLKFLMPFEVTPQLVIHAVTFRDDMRGALLLGYRYNTALGHGATLGGRLAKHLSPKVELEGMWGVSYYPKAADELRGDQVAEDTSFNFPPQLGYGLTVGVLFYP